MSIKAGHGVTFSITSEPVAAPGDFDVVGELSSDFAWPQKMRPRTEVLAHERGIDQSVFGVLKRGSLSVTFSYDEDDPTHTTLDTFLNNNTFFGVKIEGPGGSRVWIMSGGLESIDYNDPIGEGVRSMDVVFWPSGNMWVDGVLVDGMPTP